MQDKRVTIRIPFEVWIALRKLQTVVKISSIQQVAVIGMNKLIGRLDEVSAARKLDLAWKAEPTAS